MVGMAFVYEGHTETPFSGNLTLEEQRSHFATWAFLKSPILLGTDVRVSVEE